MNNRKMREIEQEDVEIYIELIKPIGKNRLNSVDVLNKFRDKLSFFTFSTLFFGLL